MVEICEEKQEEQEWKKQKRKIEKRKKEGVVSVVINSALEVGISGLHIITNINLHKNYSNAVIKYSSP